MFCSSPGSGGKQGREAGLPAPGDHPNFHLNRGNLSVRHDAADGDLGTMVCGGAGKAGPELTGPTQTGKFYQVAPEPGREAGPGARLILENSTVCQKSTN